MEFFLNRRGERFHPGDASPRIGSGIGFPDVNTKNIIFEKTKYFLAGENFRDGRLFPVDFFGDGIFSRKFYLLRPGRLVS